MSQRLVRLTVSRRATAAPDQDPPTVPFALPDTDQTDPCDSTVFDHALDPGPQTSPDGSCYFGLPPAPLPSGDNKLVTLYVIS